MNYEELKSKTVGELYDMCHERKKELLSLRIQLKTQQLTNTSSMKKNRREVAQLKTRIYELKRQEAKNAA